MDSSQLLWAAGAGAFGIFVGFIVRYFLERFERYDLKALIGLVGVPIGTTVLVFVRDFGTYSRPAYTVGLVLGLVLYQAFYSKFPSLPMRRRGTSMFAMLESINKLTLDDAGGAAATLERRQKMRFNRDANEILLSKVQSDGAIENVRLIDTGGRVAQVDRRGRAGTTYVYARFNSPLKKDETVELTFAIDWKGAFTTDRESIEITVEQETDRISFEVRFPPGRLCRAAELVKAFGANEDLVAALQPGAMIRADVPGRIQIAESYRLDWNW